MLENYYDINKKDKFEELFGDLHKKNLLIIFAVESLKK